MFLKDSLNFFSLVKEIFGFKKTKDYSGIFFHLIPLYKESIFSLSKEEKKEFFYNLNTLMHAIGTSIIGLRILILGGEIQIDKTGISVRRGKESLIEILPYLDLLESNFFKAFRNIINIVNKKIFNNQIYIYRLSFVINSFINLDSYWEPYQHLFGFVKYWSSKTRKWSRLSEGRIKRMDIKEVGDIFQGLSYKVFGFDNNIINIDLSYKEVILTFKNDKNELKVKKMLLEIKRKYEKEETTIIRNIINDLFSLLMDQAKISELLDSSLPKNIFRKWFVKIRNFFFGHSSIKRNFRVIFSQKEN